MLDWIIGGGGGGTAAAAARSMLSRLTLVLAVAGRMQDAEKGLEERVHDDESGSDDADVHFDDGEGVGRKVCPCWF